MISLFFLLLLIPSQALALDWENSGATVAVPSGQTLNATGTGEITATSINGTASDGSRYIDLQQNTTTPSAPADDFTRFHCDKDFITTGIDACFEYTNGTTSPGPRTITEDQDEGMYVTLMATPPSTAGPSGYTKIYAKSSDSKLYHYPNGGSEELICSGSCSSGYLAYAASSIGTNNDYYQNWRAISGDGGHVSSSTSNHSTILPHAITVTDLDCAISAAFATAPNGRTVYIQKNGADSSCAIDYKDGSSSPKNAGGCSVIFSAGDTIQLHWDETGSAGSREVSCVITYTQP